MSPPREASREFLTAVLEATNRRTAADGNYVNYILTEEELLDMAPLRVLGAVEELLDLLPGSGEGEVLNVKWGYDDEGIHPGLPPYDEIDKQGVHEKVDIIDGPYGTSFTVTRRDTLISVRENHSNNGGDILFWLS